MTHPTPGVAAEARPSPLFDSLIVFLGPPAVGFEDAWAGFQAAADRSVAEAEAHPWWNAEQRLFAAITTPKDGNAPAVELLLSMVLGRRVHVTPSLHLMHHRGAWVPAIAIPLHRVRDDTRQPLSPHELVAHGKQLGAAFGLALGRSWVRWFAPVEAPGHDELHPSVIGHRSTVTPSDELGAR